MTADCYISKASLPVPKEFWNSPFCLAQEFPNSLSWLPTVLSVVDPGSTKTVSMQNKVPANLEVTSRLCVHPLFNWPHHTAFPEVCVALHQAYTIFGKCGTVQHTLQEMWCDVANEMGVCNLETAFCHHFSVLPPLYHASSWPCVGQWPFQNQVTAHSLGKAGLAPVLSQLDVNQ